MISNEHGKFPTNPSLTFQDDGRTAILDEDFSYIHPNGVTYTAPAGMVTDGASIPSFLWGIVGSPFTGLLHAALIHDHMWGGDRVLANSVFYSACRCCGCNVLHASLLYNAVEFARLAGISPGDVERDDLEYLGQI